THADLADCGEPREPGAPYPREGDPVRPPGGRAAMTGGRPSAARILVVEGDPTVAEVVVRYLERDGHHVECVGDGAEALRRALTHRPDLVILDLMLPNMDGLQVCRRLRERWPVPVIMLAALGEDVDRVVGLGTGADDYVTDP